MNIENSINNTIKNSSNLNIIISLCEKKINKKLNNIEINSLQNYINELNLVSLVKKNNNLSVINNSISEGYINHVTKPNLFDIQEYLKNDLLSSGSIDSSRYEYSSDSLKKISDQSKVKEYIPPIQPEKIEKSNIENTQLVDSIQNLIYMQKKQIESQQDSKQSQQLDFSSISTSNLVNYARILNINSLYRDSNILIDSRYQNLANTDKSKISFTIVSDTKAKIPGSGVITSISNITNIVEIEVFPFSIPYISSADNYYKKVTLSILELSSIAIDAYENVQFHFMFTATKNKNLLDLEPVNSTFRFYKPVSKISDFTLRFGSPFAPIIFDNDRLPISSIDYGSNPGLITFETDHNLISGDIIYINEFTTLNPARDLYIINDINSSNGHLCTRVSNTSISINIDFTIITNPDTNLRIYIYFGSKRILMPLRIRYLQSEIGI